MKKKKSKNKISNSIIIILLISILAIVTAGILIGTNCVKTNTINDNFEQGIVFDNNAVTYNEKINNKSNSNTGIKVPGYPDMTISSESKDFPITLLNPKGNSCNFKFSLIIKETNEKIYSSGYVKPGDAINGITLNKSIPKGNYTLIINIATRSVSTNAEMNGAQVNSKLTVI